MNERPKRQNERERKKLGIQPMDFLASWIGKRVALTTMAGEEIRGILVGISTYDLVLQRPDGVPLYVFKHAVATIREVKDGE